MSAPAGATGVADRSSGPGASVLHEAELLALLDALRKFERDFKLGQRFNLFEALGVGRQEIRHSRFLAYLLDPREPHGLGDRFLRGMLLAAVEGQPQPPVNRLALSIRDLSDASVMTERDHFDVTVQIPSLGLLFVIENKVGASESDKQLATYRDRALARHAEYHFMGCFLTPDGYPGEDPNWSSLSYATVAKEIRAVLDQATLSPEVSLALHHYIELVERKIVASQALIEACRELYSAHKAALHLVMEHGEQSTLALAYEQFAAVHPELVLLTRQANRLFFAHKGWLELPRAQVAEKKRWHCTFPVLMWFELAEKKLFLRLEIGPFLPEFAEERPSLVAIFRGAFPGGSNRDSPTFTRMRPLSESVGEEPSMEDVLAVMCNLWRKLESSHGGIARVDLLIQQWVSGLERQPVNQAALGSIEAPSI